MIFNHTIHATDIHSLTNQHITINRCEIERTDNVLDLALTNDGYFVVSQGKKNSELLFTRYGKFRINQDDYIVTENGSYLLGINSKSDPNKLSKLKISWKSLPPKVTSKVSMILNLDHNLQDNSSFKSESNIFDEVGGQHSLEIEYKKNSDNSWGAQVFVDDIKLNKGMLIFRANGKLKQQEGLSHIHWPSKYGLNQLKIDYKGTTSYASPSSIESIRGDGYVRGSLAGVMVDNHGSVSLFYTNGQFKKLKHTIAVAKFANPNYLDPVLDHLYRSSEKSGSQRLHRLNSEYAILSGALEKEPCFVG